ncbi:uncharacterized protein MONOS_4466 [Monocercomonoides exilis]|uniref:uncharacterized protein n=1 Tax=Monocercomonoides exilis TaxID=2049356 RepID=UPI00355A5D75|nr:hypothetical protein MONOS_4466 [Monocercomonoides exilis]|eukprot:MONOS_4466.1-p1 / transcript=MONOS_4466.1 / gene=MONOS_4466 / organism=Monocercomonoides_exilis_PA203 / gene_product=unspecified product / transcript_product=unspecified product / location=Mono_scaffold00119:27013-28842(-) / protein_length=609 / sequence_SO=supercontig / SO=protein_coding / is_pseudo=false
MMLAFFMPAEFDHYERKYQTYHFFRSSEFLDHLKDVTTRFFNWKQTTVGDYSVNIDDSPPLSKFSFYEGWPKDGQPPKISRISEKTFTLTEDNPLGPFNEDENKQKLSIRMMKQYKITFKFSTHRHNWAEGKNSSHLKHNFDKWEVELTYDFTNRGVISLGYDLTRKVESITVGDYIRVAINIALLILSIIQLVLTWKSLTESYFILSEVRKIYEDLLKRGEFHLPWSAIPSRQKRMFFNTSNVLTFISSLSCLIGSVIEILTLVGVMGQSRLGDFLRGITALLVFTNFLRFFLFSKNYSMSVKVTGASLPVIWRMTVGAFPFFFGCMLMACSLYSDHHEWFDGFGQTTLTLWGVMNGDVILDLWSGIFSVSPLFGLVFEIGFVFFFIYIIVNLYYSIIEEAYFQTKRQLYSDWEWNEAAGVTDEEWERLIGVLWTRQKEEQRERKRRERIERKKRRIERRERVLKMKEEENERKKQTEEDDQNKREGQKEGNEEKDQQKCFDGSADEQIDTSALIPVQPSINSAATLMNLPSSLPYSSSASLTHNDSSFNVLIGRKHSRDSRADISEGFEDKNGREEKEKEKDSNGYIAASVMSINSDEMGSLRSEDG